MSHADLTYNSLVRQVLDYGTFRQDRTGVGTKSLFGAQARYDLRQGFPLLTSKKVNFGAVWAELRWFLQGGTNTDSLDCGIWDAWADADGNLGPIYGHQWRRWGAKQPDMPWPWVDPEAPIDQGYDQLTLAIEQAKSSPYSRRIIVSAWNVAELEVMRLPPCHVLWQLYVEPSTGELDLQLYQRSADLALGVPFNVASYSLLLSMIAAECGLKPRFFIHSLGDVHAYLPHLPGLEEQLSREPRPAPLLHLNPSVRRVLDYRKEDVGLVGYEPHPPIAFEVAV